MMNLNDLIGGAPGVLEGLYGLGLEDRQVNALGDEAERQILGGAAGDLTSLLGGLDVTRFIARIDVGQLAERVGIDIGVARAALQKLAPAVDAFSGEGGSDRPPPLAGAVAGVLSAGHDTTGETDR